MKIRRMAGWPAVRRDFDRAFRLATAPFAAAWRLKQALVGIPTLEFIFILQYHLVVENVDLLLGPWSCCARTCGRRPPAAPPSPPSASRAIGDPRAGTAAPPTAILLG